VIRVVGDVLSPSPVRTSTELLRRPTAGEGVILNAEFGPASRSMQLALEVHYVA